MRLQSGLLPKVTPLVLMVVWVAARAVTVEARSWQSTASNAPAAEPPQPELRYLLRLLRPTTHLMEVEIAADKLTAPRLDFMMPAWAPGRYAIYDFAKNVQEFTAWDAQGQALGWTKIDKQTWRVESRQTSTALGTVRVRYRVFANDLSGSFSQFDSTHASLNGASIFMYIAGRRRDPLGLTVEGPPAANSAWKLISGLSPSNEPRSFTVRNYDLLVDTPMEISTECSLDEFSESGKNFGVAVHSYPEPTSDRSKLIEGLKKLVRSEMTMMPAADFDRYTFIFHFAPDIPLGDGMEHLNSTEIVVRANFDDDGIREALEIAAHEFFHLWNVKRLRPVGLASFDYSRETYTPSLWFAEGVTSYYAYLHLLRSGLWTRQEFLKRLAQEIRNLEAEPGRALMSAESSSFHAWFYDRSPQMQETNFANSTVSYYNKGLVLGMLLDLEVRARAEGRRSLDDVLVSLYAKFAEAPTAIAAGSGSGYQEKDIVEVLSAVSGSDFKPFFEKYIQGTEPLPYASILGRAGLKLRAAAAPGASPSLGVLTQRVDNGLKIVALRPDRAADRAGLARDDVVTEVDNLSLAADDLDSRLQIYPPGAQVPLTVERHGREERITVTLDPPPQDTYSIEELPDAAPAQLKVRGGWLRSEK